MAYFCEKSGVRIAGPGVSKAIDPAKGHDEVVVDDDGNETAVKAAKPKAEPKPKPAPAPEPKPKAETPEKTDAKTDTKPEAGAEPKADAKPGDTKN